MNRSALIRYALQEHLRRLLALERRNAIGAVIMFSPSAWKNIEAGRRLRLGRKTESWRWSPLPISSAGQAAASSRTDARERDWPSCDHNSRPDFFYHPKCAV